MCGRSSGATEEASQVGTRRKTSTTALGRGGIQLGGPDLNLVGLWHVVEHLPMALEDLGRTNSS